MATNTKRASAALITDSVERVKGKVTGSNHWGAAHARAWINGSIPSMIDGWAVYADTHYSRYGSTIGDDGVLGPAWRSIGEGLLTLLNGELRGLDAGTVDGLIRAIMANEGIDDD